MILETIIIFTVIIILAYIIRHLIFTITVLYHTKKNQNPVHNDPTFTPTVTILIPAKNEENVIGRILQRMTELTYPKERLQVIVINDASSDRTGQIADFFAKRYPFIEVIHRDFKEGGKGKPSALNAGLKIAKGEIILCFDADYYPQVNIIEKLISPFSDPKVGAVQGRVVVLNEPQNIVTRLATLERVGGYCIDQRARQMLGLIPQYGGANGGVRREILEEFGGFDETMLAEDTDLTFKAYLAGYEVCYLNDAESYEEAVKSWRAYWRQRFRWILGHMQCAFRYLIPLVKSENLNLKQKVDGILLLNIYFLPIIVAVAWILGGILVILDSTHWIKTLWCFIPFSLYCCVGNFAPFFEVGAGLYCDGRSRACWLIPLLFPAFIYNTIICTAALFKLVIYKMLGKKHFGWNKTVHYGHGNSYILEVET